MSLCNKCYERPNSGASSPPALGLTPSGSLQQPTCKRLLGLTTSQPIHGVEIIPEWSWIENTCHWWPILRRQRVSRRRDHPEGNRQTWLGRTSKFGASQRRMKKKIGPNRGFIEVKITTYIGPLISPYTPGCLFLSYLISN